ncbi:hypothetical protein [Noviluteimonas gilva]|uniref:Uncharacterized protein n=1 Tax=Noviluteimonas gilva TaxID=2682097 RepID=A0A7C9HNP5_9GAMM|nr:hypothetical protein [Lysobacter gilvus]MUV15350.1 hypothetical protein [Lysobacter gilvus]
MPNPRVIVAMVLALGLVAGGFAIRMKPGESAQKRLESSGLRTGPSAVVERSVPSSAKAIRPLQADERSLDPRIVAFRNLNACEKYARHRDFVSELKTDPYSWLNRDETRKLMSSDDLRDAEATVAFVENNAQRCEPVRPRTIESNIALYESALAAALAGDRMAARCFVLAPWPSSVGDDAPHQRLQDIYVSNVEGLVTTGIDAGDLDMVRLAGAIRATHGHGLVAIGLPYDARKAYAYLQLQALFAREPEARSITTSIERLAHELKPDEQAAEDAWAKATFAKSFASRPYSAPLPACDR